MPLPDRTDIFLPVVKDSFQGFSCKLCGHFMSWWEMFAHFQKHVREDAETYVRQQILEAEDELTD